MCTKYETLRTFYDTLTQQCLSEGQKKAILLKLNRRQRLGIAELIINVLIGNLKISGDTRELLANHSSQLRLIARQGKDVTNQQLARYSKAIILALTIALKHLEKRDIQSVGSNSEESLLESTKDKDKLEGDSTNNEDKI
jgi:hypothetical protein